MKIGLVAAATVCLASSSAFAGVFVGLGVGTGTDFDDAHVSKDGRSTRIEGGYAMPLGPGRIAADVLYQDCDVMTSFSARPMNATMLALAARYNLALSNGFEVFARLGVHRTSVDSDVQPLLDMHGTGKLLGAGAEFHPQFKLPVDLGFFVDLTYASATLNPDPTDHGTPTNKIDGAARFATMGVTVGF